MDGSGAYNSDNSNCFLCSAFKNYFLIDITSTGTLTNRSDGELDNYFTLNNSGTLVNSGMLNNSGTLNNNGLLTSSVALNNHGTLNNNGTLTN